MIIYNYIHQIQSDKVKCTISYLIANENDTHDKKKIKLTQQMSDTKFIIT